MLLRDPSGTLSPRSVAEATAALRDHLWHAAITLWAFSSKVTILLAKNMWCHPLGSTHEVYDLQLWVFESQLGHLRVADAFSTRDERTCPTVVLFAAGEQGLVSEHTFCPWHVVQSNLLIAPAPHQDSGVDTKWTRVGPTHMTVESVPEQCAGETGVLGKEHASVYTSFAIQHPILIRQQ